MVVTIPSKHAYNNGKSFIHISLTNITYHVYISMYTYMWKYMHFWAEQAWFERNPDARGMVDTSNCFYLHAL